jgi:hypothetical protein
LAIAEEIKIEHAPMCGEIRRNPTPLDGRKWRPMEQDERGAFADYAVADPLTLEIEDP